MFKVGDIITGKPISRKHYNWTTDQVTMKVVKVLPLEEEDIQVVILESSDERYWVNSKYFKLVEPALYFEQQLLKKIKTMETRFKNKQAAKLSKEK